MRTQSCVVIPWYVVATIPASYPILGKYPGKAVVQMAEAV